jgi:secretion/DNA translocation related TadE-like protein
VTPGPGRGRGRGRAERDERGGATVFVVACLGVLLLVGAALGVAAAAIAAHRTAQAAADLAALAAAADLADGGAGCPAGAVVAAANRAEQTACRVDGDEVVLDVVVDGPSWLGWTGDLTARARAGPSSEPGEPGEPGQPG